jgi:hypothetical protein
MVSHIALIYNQVFGCIPSGKDEELILLKSEFSILDNCLLVSIPKFFYYTLPKSVKSAVQFPKMQFVVQFPKIVRYSVQVSTGADRQFLNLNASLVSCMDRPGSS